MPEALWLASPLVNDKGRRHKTEVSLGNLNLFESRANTPAKARPFGFESICLSLTRPSRPLRFASIRERGGCADI